MSQNLIEFLKVLTIVITWTAGLTLGRHYFLSLDESEEEDEDMSGHQEQEF